MVYDVYELPKPDSNFFIKASLSPIVTDDAKAGSADRTEYLKLLQRKIYVLMLKLSTFWHALKKLSIRMTYACLVFLFSRMAVNNRKYNDKNHKYFNFMNPIILIKSSLLLQQCRESIICFVVSSCIK